MINIPAFKEYEMSLDTVDKLVTYLDSLDLPNVSSSSPYHNNVDSYQSSNLLCVDDRINKIIDDVIADLNKDLGLKSTAFHAHYIKYADQGSVDWHTHDHSEELSLILYLTDAEGNTVISLNDKRGITLSVSPKKGKIILFSSVFNHIGLESKNKKVFVIAIRLPEVIQV